MASRPPQRHRPPHSRPAGVFASQAGQPGQPPSGRAADAVDLHVGGRVRLARKTLDMSQEALAERLGITFQQLQKYEKGVNRISASRLHHAARVLGVPVTFFFPEGDVAPAAGSAASQPLATMEFLSTADGVELNRAFSQIEDAAVRQRVIDLVQSLATSSGPAQGGAGSRRAGAGKGARSGASTAPRKRFSGKNG